MKKQLTIFLCTALLFGLAVSCGGGDEPEATFTINGTVTFTDFDFFPEQQNVVFGLFNPGEIQPIRSVSIPKPTANPAQFSISNVEGGSYEMALYISENIIRKADLATYGNVSVNDHVQLPAKSATFVSFARVQEQIFDYCLQCHGGSSQTAAGLNLLPGRSYGMLVNQPSTNSDKLRVEPGNVDQSFLIQVLNKDNLPFDHSASTSATPGDIQLIANWINNGAPND